MQITNYLGVITFLYPVKIFLDIIFSYKTGRPYTFISWSNKNINVLDIMLCLVFLIRINKEYFAYRYNLDKFEPNSTPYHETYYNNIYHREEDEEFLSYLYAIAATLLWIRILFLIRFTKLLGPLMKIILSMSWDFFVFILLFVLGLVIFGIVGTLLFGDVSAYNSFYNAVLTLVSSSLGEYDFETLQNSEKGRVMGDLYLLFFLITTNILALNLLIAILSNTYQTLSIKTNILFLSEILKLRTTLEYDKNYGAMVSTFPPWNVFVVPTIPFYLLRRNTYTLN